MVTQQESIGKSSAVSGNSAGSKSNTQKDKKNKKNTGNVTTKVTTYKTTGTLITLTAGQDNPVNELTSDLVGGTITITNPHTLVESDLYTTAAGYTLPTTYSSTILKVKNSKEFEVLEPYTITDKNNKTFPVSLNSGNASITYDTYKTFTEDTVYQRSYANITVGNLRTFSGDVYKAKIYTRDSGTSTDYEQVYENYVIPENELVDESSITGYDNIGFFHTESIIDNSWISSSTAGDTGQFVTLTNEKLIDSVSISGSVSGINDKVLFRTKNANTLQKGVDYVVRFNTYYYKSLSERRTSNDKIENKNYASLKVYLSGSATTGANGEDDVFIGEVDVTDSMGSEGEILGVVGQFRTAGTGTTKTWLKFELNSGEFHIQDVSIEPFSETNFNPNFFKALVPMPKPVKRGDSYDFLVEFYDCNNNISTTTAEVKGVTFQGPRQVIADGLDGVFEGAMVLGDSVEFYGSNPAYIRSVGYNGFDKTKAGTGERDGGFLIWSGSIGNGATLNRLTASEAYEGVGIEILDASDSDTYNHSFLQFASNYKNTGNSRFRVQTKEFLLGLSGSGQAGDTYISGSEGNLEISSSNFHLSSSGNLNVGNSAMVVTPAGDLTLQGSITATAGGQIGGFTITDKAISTTDFFLSGSAYSGTGFQKTNLVLSSSGFQINSDGQISASEGVIGGFGIDGHSLTTTGVEINDSTQGLFISSSTFKVDHSGNVTASNVDLSGKITATIGEIGGFTIDDHSLTSTGIEINDSTQTYFISSSNFKVKHTGEVSGSNVLFTGGEIGGFTITDSALSSGNTFFISGSPGTTDNLLKSNLLISSSNFLVSGVGRISASRGQIGGFDITDTFISSSNLILNSTGQITSKDYASNLKGFFLGPVEMTDGSVGSFLEVDEARIRGTLKTTVFEKESVNAVGGQLHVANATTITGSATMSVDDTTMQVANAGGFEAGEIILLKKFNSTGFTTEYMKVHSVAREDGGSATNFSGSLVVTRSLGTTGGSDFMGALGASAQEYTPGQVVVSTGKNGTGYIRLNANPNDTSTPYIDIVERTGDGVYDIDLKARLGDLSGLSTAQVGSNPGFGLFSENVFLTGNISATSGDIGGWRIENTKITSSDGTTEIISGEGGKIAMGPTLPTDLSSNGIFLSGSGQFNLQSGASDYIRNGTSGFDIKAGTFGLDATTIIVSSSLNNGTIALGTAAGGMGLSSGNDGVYMDGGGNFRVGGASDNFLKFTGGTLSIDIDDIDITSSAFDLVTSTIHISSSGGGTIAMGSTIPKGGDFTDTGIMLSGSGYFNLQASPTNYIRNNASGFDIKSDTFTLDANSGDLTIDSANKKITINNSTFGQDGLQLEHTTGGAKFYVGDGSNKHLKFDGTDVDIKSDSFDLEAISSGRGISIDSSTPSILIQSSSGGSVVGKVLLTAGTTPGVGNTTAASLIVSQSGQPIFSVGGEDFSFTSTQNLVVNSFPVENDDVLAPGDSVADFSIPATQNSFENSSDTNTNTAGGGAPTVKVTNLLVSSQMSASRFRAGKSLYLKNTADEASSRTTFNVSVLDQRASGSATNSPAVAGFDIKRNYDTFTVNDQIPQAVVFSSVISSSLVANTPRFVPNGAPSGSAIFHFQSLLREGSAGNPTFQDGKKCVVRIDSDVYQSGAPENEFVFIEGRAASGSYTTPTTIWQIQADGDFVTRGDITAFGVNSNFNTVSDRRFKKDVHTISGSMDKILQLRPTEFTWIEKNKQDVGFIAQEVEEIIPEVINTTTGMIEEGKETQEVKTISYPKLVPYLVDTIQVLTKRIEELEKKVK